MRVENDYDYDYDRDVYPPLDLVKTGREPPATANKRRSSISGVSCAQVPAWSLILCGHGSPQSSSGHSPLWERPAYLFWQIRAEIARPTHTQG